LLRNLFWKVGVLGDYRRVFWKFAWSGCARATSKALISSSLVAHHLIVFARAASSGQQNASNYSLRAARSVDGGRVALNAIGVGGV